MLNGILCIDKPAGWTSHDVVARARRLLMERRIGHGGTLDPMATGLLPLLVGKATAAMQFMNNSKRYEARFLTGFATNTQDTTGTLTQRSEKSPAPEDIIRTAALFTGELLQIPPMVSAVKVGGRKLYEIARKGGEVERAPRKVTVTRFDVSVTETPGEYRAVIECGSGVYVRTLIHDLGVKLGCYAALSALRRTQAGPFEIKDAITLEVLEKQGRDAALRPVTDLFAGCTEIRLGTEDSRRVSNGMAIANKYGAAPGENCLIFSENGGFLCLSQETDGLLKSRKNFF